MDKGLIAILAVAAILILAGAGPAPTPEAPAVTWQYATLVMDVDNASFTAGETRFKADDSPGSMTKFAKDLGAKPGGLPMILDALGAQGWELVAVDGRGESKTFYFKRHK